MNDPGRLRERLREALGPRTAGEALAGDAPRQAAAPWSARPAEAFADGLEPLAVSKDIHQLLPGFWQDTAAGRVFVIERRFELEHRHGRLALGRALESSPELWARIGRQPALGGVNPRRVAFLDIETTGLSGGTGTLAFLVGIGHFLDGHFRLRQYFLGGLGQERAMLRALTDYLADFEAVVTFNGKSFDLPLLHTRLVISGMSTALTELPHFDLLHPSRRLYRDRLTSCRLGEIERWLLGLTREDDIRGADVPALYFRYIRYRRARSLLPVFEHNALDVLSLVTLTVYLCRLFGGDPRLSGADRFALGRDCEGDDRPDEAVAQYEAALTGDLRQTDHDECEKRLSLLYKKLGRWEQAVALWQTVSARPDNRMLYPLIELAKYHERTARDFAAARLITERALLLLEGHHARMGYTSAAAERAALEKRLVRLDERAARSRMRPTGRRVRPAE